MSEGRAGERKMYIWVVGNGGIMCYQISFMAIGLRKVRECVCVHTHACLLNVNFMSETDSVDL